MHAVVAIFEMDPAVFDTGLRVLNERIVPGASRAPGFLAGYWTHDRATHVSYNMLLFDSREAAGAVADDIQGHDRAGTGTSLMSVAITEVIAQAVAPEATGQTHS